jgi:hypothetical protein
MFEDLVVTSGQHRFHTGLLFGVVLVGQNLHCCWVSMLCWKQQRLLLPRQLKVKGQQDVRVWALCYVSMVGLCSGAAALLGD